MQRLEDVDELLPEPVLERHAVALDPARDEDDLLVLDVDALERADPLGEVEHLGLGERLEREPAAVALPHERRIEALLDRRPDRERRREVVAVDDEVGAVAHADLVDLGEELVGGVPREDVRQAGLDADAGEAEDSRLAPLLVLVELVLAEQRVGRGERHRHVEIRHARVERRGEERRVEARVARVEHRVGLLGAQELGDGARRPTRRPAPRQSDRRPRRRAARARDRRRRGRGARRSRGALRSLPQPRRRRRLRRRRPSSKVGWRRRCLDSTISPNRGHKRGFDMKRKYAIGAVLVAVVAVAAAMYAFAAPGAGAAGGPAQPRLLVPTMTISATGQKQGVFSKRKPAASWLSRTRSSRRATRRAVCRRESGSTSRSRSRCSAGRRRRSSSTRS